MHSTALPAPAFSGARDTCASAAPDALLAALLAFGRAPGRFSLALREPAILFERLSDVLQLAIRRTQAAQEDPAQAQAAEAALLFIGAALLAPGRSHYEVFGSAPGFAPADLRQRYRLLMRLAHPDFARDGQATWPQDAAARINLAYEVMSSPQRRQLYDEALAANVRVPAAGVRPRATRCQPVRRSFPVAAGKRPVVATAACTLLAAAIAVFMLPDSNAVQIVERKHVQAACPDDEAAAAHSGTVCAPGAAGTRPQPVSLQIAPVLR